MRPVHLTPRPDLAERGAPYNYTACGETSSSRFIVVDPLDATCPQCLAQAGAHPAQQITGQPQEAPNPDDPFGDILPDGSEVEASEASGGDEGAAMIREMLMGVIEGAEISRRAAVWLKDTDDESSIQLDIRGGKQTGLDIRELLSEEDRQRLVALHGMLEMVEAGEVGLYLLTLVDQLASEAAKWRAISASQMSLGTKTDG